MSQSRGPERASADNLLHGPALRQDQLHLSPPQRCLFNLSGDVSCDNSCSFSGSCNSERGLAEGGCVGFFLISKLKLSSL